MPFTKRKPRWRRWLLDAAIVLAVFIGLQLWFTQSVVRGPLPALPGTLVGQSDVDAQAWRAQHGGDGFVLYVWATWCGVCKAIEGNIDDLAQRAPLLTVAMQSGAEPQVQHHLARRQQAWPTLNDPNASIAHQLGVDAVPTLLFIDRHGRVRSVTQGYTTTVGLHARLFWARMF